MHGLRLGALRRLYRLAYWLLRAERVLRPGRSRRGVKCLLLHGDEVLLVRHTYGPDRWQLPGGGAHRGEPPPSVAAREMHEELGVRGLQWHELATGNAPLPQLPRGSACLWAELSDPTVHPDPVEIVQVRWFARCALPAGCEEDVSGVLAVHSAERGPWNLSGSLP